jgi:hypothetical protein
MHRVRCFDFQHPARAAKCPNAMAQPLGRCIVKVRPASWSFGLLQLKLARTRPGAQHGCCACNHHGPYHHLICSWATLLSACRPATQLRLVTCDDADNMCSPGSRSHYTGQFSWYCSPLIKRTPDCCRSFEQRRIKHTSKNFVLPPICLHVYL